MVIVSHPTGNANVAAVVAALDEEQLLTAYFTCIYWRPEARFARWVPAGLRGTLERRARVQIPPEKIHTRPGREVVRNLLLRAGKKRFASGEDQPFSIDAVYRDLDRLVARRLRDFPDARAVYAYEDGALEQFRAARQRGLRCIYDLPIGYWRASRAIAAEEVERRPEWAPTLQALTDSAAKCARKDEELELADTVLVPSSFVRRTLEHYPGERKQAVVTPFGVPAAHAAPRRRTDRSQPLRVIFVGGLSQRKGIADLFDAVEKLGSAVSLTVIGRKPTSGCKALDQACSRYRWIASLSHAQVLEEMRAHDVFVFPSLFEGLALVLGEAISQGLPVITTPNSGGEDILRDGVDSFLVPIRAPEAIAERLLLLHEDRQLLKSMSDAALARACELTWTGYQRRVVFAVRESEQRKPLREKVNLHSNGTGGR